MGKPYISIIQARLTNDFLFNSSRALLFIGTLNCASSFSDIKKLSSRGTPRKTWPLKSGWSIHVVTFCKITRQSYNLYVYIFLYTNHWTFILSSNAFGSSLICPVASVLSQHFQYLLTKFLKNNKFMIIN